MRWRPDPEHTSAWSAAGGAVMVLAGTAIVVLTTQPASSRIPSLVIWVCAGLAAVGLYGMLAPLMHWRPWHRRTGNAEMNRLIYRQWRALKWRRRLGRLLRRPREVEHTVLPTSRPPMGSMTAPQVPLPLVASQDPPKAEAARSIQNMRREAARRAVRRTPQEEQLRDLRQRVQALSEHDDQRPVSDAHRDMLKGVARKLRSYVDASQHAYYVAKGDERKAQAFQEHFPDVTERITAWNQQIAAFEAERRELERWVEQRLRMLGYQQPPFAWGYAGLIAERAAVEGVELPFQVPQIAPLWLQLGPYPLVPDPPPNDRTREGIENELRGVLSEARLQPQCGRIHQIRDSLAAVSEPLISDLDLIQAKDLINGLGDCVLCR